MLSFSIPCFLADVPSFTKHENKTHVLQLSDKPLIWCYQLWRTNHGSTISVLKSFFLHIVIHKRSRSHQSRNQGLSCSLRYVWVQEERPRWASRPLWSTLALCLAPNARLPAACLPTYRMCYRHLISVIYAVHSNHVWDHLPHRLESFQSDVWSVESLLSK